MKDEKSDHAKAQSRKGIPPVDRLCDCELDDKSLTQKE